VSSSLPSVGKKFMPRPLQLALFPFIEQ
jgi:hypothetical protein